MILKAKVSQLVNWIAGRCTAAKGYCVEQGLKVSRRMKGRRFPQGFDEWCQQTEVPNWPDLGWEEFMRSQNFQTNQDAMNAYIKKATQERAGFRSLNMGACRGGCDCVLRFPDGSKHANGQIGVNAWSLSLGGNVGKLQISNLTAHTVYVDLANCKGPISFTDSVLGKIYFKDTTRFEQWHSLELNNCWIGTLNLAQASLKNLTITGGGIGKIDCPPADSPNPFKGAVLFRDVFFPTSSRSTNLFDGAQPYRSLHAHLKKHDNMLMANLMRSRQLRAERSSERGFTRVANWVYGTFADYGTSPGRPLLWMVGLYLLAFVYLYHCDYGTIAQAPQFYVGANERLLDEHGGRLYRSLLLPLQSIVSPFGIFFDPRKFIVPNTMVGSTLLTIQGLFSDLLVLMTILSVRRRFKAE